MTYHRVCDKRITTGATCGAGTVYPYRAPEFTPCFEWGSCCSIFSFLCSVLYIIVRHFVVFLLIIVLSVFLQFTASDYPFDIFKLFSGFAYRYRFTYTCTYIPNYLFSFDYVIVIKIKHIKSFAIN